MIFSPAKSTRAGVLSWRPLQIKIRRGKSSSRLCIGIERGYEKNDSSVGSEMSKSFAQLPDVVAKGHGKRHEGWCQCPQHDSRGAARRDKYESGIVALEFLKTWTGSSGSPCLNGIFGKERKEGLKRCWLMGPGDKRDWQLVTSSDNSKPICSTARSNCAYFMETKYLRVKNKNRRFSSWTVFYTTLGKPLEQKKVFHGRLFLRYYSQHGASVAVCIILEGCNFGWDKTCTFERMEKWVFCRVAKNYKDQEN